MSVQTENGYTKIANELLEALARFRIPGEQRQCLDIIFRKTYGFNKKEDRISNKQFRKATGLNKSNVCRAIRQLILKKIVVKSDNSYVPSYCFNKKYQEWVGLSKMTTKVVKNDNKRLSKVTDTKDNTKENIKKSKKEKFDPQKNKPDFIPEKDWNDILEQRRKKKAPETKRALKSLSESFKEAVDAGYTITDCVNKYTQRGWTGFELEWMENIKFGNNQKSTGGDYI